MRRFWPIFILLTACTGGDMDSFANGPEGTTDDGDADGLLQEGAAVNVDIVEHAPSQCRPDGSIFAEHLAIDFQHRSKMVQGDRYADAGGGGTAVFDANLDGHMDILFTQGDGCNALFLGAGDGTFSETTISPELAACERSTNGAVPFDLNHDEWQDLVMFHQTTWETDYRLEVFLGGPDGFTHSQVLDESSRTYAVHPGDFDGDGNVDLLAMNFLPIHEPGSMDPWNEIACNGLYMGLGDGTFADGGDRLTDAHCQGAGMAAATVHNYSTDALDIWATNDKGHFISPNHYSRNLGGGEFEDASAEVYFQDGTNAMGIAAGYLEDELSFLIVGGGSSNLLLQESGGQFIDIATARGVNENDGFHMGWGGWFYPEFIFWSQGDFTNSPAVQNDMDVYQPPMAMRKMDGGASFERVQEPVSFYEPVNGHGSVRADFNGDGLPDLVKMQVDNLRPYGVFLGNNCPEEGAVSVELFGRDGNPPVGIRVELNEYAEVYAASMGLFGAGEPLSFFQGSGQLVIHWSSQEVTRLDVEAGHHYVVELR